MPDVGVLQLKISADAGNASRSLKALQTRLSEINTLAQSNFNLGNVSTQIQNIVNAVKGDKGVSTAVKNLGTLLNAISAFSKVKGIGLNEEEVKKLSTLQTVANGFKLGNAGTQLNKLREALGGSWNTDQAESARQALETLSAGARTLSESGTATKIKDVTKSLENITAGKDNNLKETTKDIVDYQKAVDEIGETLKDAQVTFKEPLMKMNLQQFGGKQTFENESVQNWRDTMNGIREVNGGLKQTNVSSINNIGELQETLSRLARIPGAGNLQKFSDGIRAVADAAKAAGQSHLTLNRLAGALERLGNVSAGFKLPSFGKLESLARTLQENFNAENSLKRLADGINAFKAATDGLNLSNAKNISSVIRAMNSSTERSNGSASSLEAFSANIQAASNVNVSDGFAEAAGRIADINNESASAYDTMQQLDAIIQQTGWSARATAEQFEQMFAMWNTLRMSMSLNAGDIPLLLGDGMNGSGADWTYWKDGAIEVEGTVSDAMETIRVQAGQTIPLLTGVVEESEKIGESFKSYSAIDDMARRVENLRRIFANSSDTVKKIIAEIFHMEKSQLFPDDAITNVQNFGHAAQSVSGPVSQLYNSLKRDYGAEMVDNLVNASSKADLLKMRIDALKQSLATKINNNTVDGDQIAQATARIQALQAEYDQLTGKTQEVAEETKSFTERVEELIFGTDGLHGAFKRMFPTISSLLGRFRQLVKYRMLRAVIKQISEGFREGTENYYYYSKAIGSEFAPAMDSAASALLQMKNSIGAAAAPLIQSLIPLLQTAVNAFINVINYANQFFALMRGQASWSQAVPATASAFGDIENAASGAGAAIKDLLADWDELNIIQSETSKGGGGSGTQAMQDALNMFEESYEFNDKIKSAVEWIKDHMDSILAIAKSIGVAILAWKVSRAFGGLIGDLASLVLGGALIDIGLRVAYEGAYEAGYNGGFDAASFIATVGGSITAAIGGAIIGYKFFGLWGSVIGGALGLVASIGVAVYAYDKGNKQKIEESKWGSIHYTAEQIEEYARSQFTFDIDAEIEVAKAYIKNRLAAKLKLTVALAQFKASLSKASSFGVDAEIKVDTTEGQARIKALKDAADDAINTIDALRTLIDENEKGLEFTMTNFKFVDDEGADISDDLMKALKVADTTLKDYFTDIGAQISKWIYEGEKSGWANGEYQMALELMQSQQRVMDKAEELSKQKLYDLTTSSSITDAKNAYAIHDYDTAKGIIEAEQTRYEEFYNEAVASVQSQKEDLIYFASLAEAAATELESTLKKETDPTKRADIEAKINELRESAKTYTTLAEEITDDFDAKVEERVGESKKKQIEAWTAMLQEVYGADYASRLFGKTDEGGSAFEWLDDLFGLGHSTDDWIKRVIEESGVEGAAQELYNYLYASLLDVDTTGGTKFFVETLGGNLYELIKNNEDLVRDIADGLIANTDNRQIAYDIFKGMFNLDDDTASKYIQTYTQNVWEDAINGVHAELPVKPVITEAPNTNTYAETTPEEDVNIWDLMPEQSEGYDFQIDRDIDAEGFINDLQDEILTIDPVVVDVTPNFTMEDVDPSIFEKASGISSKVHQNIMRNIEAVYGAAQGMNLFGGMPSDITIHEERDSEQEASNTAEGVRRGNTDLVTGQNQANNYMAQMVRYLAIIAQKSGGSVGLAQSALGGMVSAAMEAFGNITG